MPQTAAILPPSAPLTKSDLIAYFASGEKAEKDFRIGVEFERFSFDVETKKPIPYKGAPKSILSFFEILMAEYGWQPVLENDVIIALQKGEQAITLEPGGQVELSGAPLPTLHDNCTQVRAHVAEAREIGARMGIDFMAVGFHPQWTRADMPWMPKQRYGIMRAYMPKVGELGIDMMQRTATVQVNLDFSSEADMVKKFRVSLALQPIAGAMFANSPTVEGKPSGYLSYRNRIWLDTDAARTGNLPFVFDAGMGYERYADYLLDVPMYFVKRGDTYIDASGQSFRDFMKGKLPALPGEFPVIDDWISHATCVFPDVRLKKWLEMRGADAGEWGSLCALPALWTGILYDKAACDAAADLVKDWTADERLYLKTETPKTALHTKFRSRTLADIAREVFAIAESGLKRRARLNADGKDETLFLEPLRPVIENGKAPAELTGLKGCI